MYRESVASGRALDPARDTLRAPMDVNRLFGGLRFLPRPEFPLINLYTSPEGAIAVVEVPGISPEDLEITVHRDAVSLRGERKAEFEEGEVTVQRRERMQGRFARQLVLPYRVDADKASAKFSNGVLTLELPRPESERPRHITVSRA